MTTGMRTLDALLAAQQALDSEAPAVLARRAAEAEERSRRNRRAIFTAVWENGATTGDTLADLCIAIHGARHEALYATLAAFEQRLAAHQGEFLMIREQAGRAVTFAVITGERIAFERTVPHRPHHVGDGVYDGAIGLPAAPGVLFANWEWNGAWEELKEADRSPQFSLEAHIDPNRSSVDWVQSKFQKGTYYGIRVGDAEVWRELEEGPCLIQKQSMPVPVVAAAIAEKLGRPLGTVPYWKEEARPFVERLKRELPRLKSLASWALSAKGQLGTPGDGSILAESLRLVRQLASEELRVNRLEHFLQQWEERRA